MCRPPISWCVVFACLWSFTKENHCCHHFFFSRIIFLTTTLSLGVNSRISDAYDWIRASVCAMSHYPPDDMCHVDDDSLIGTTSSFVLNNSWISWLCQILAIICAVICTLVCVNRFWSNGKWKSDNESDDARSPNNIMDEMTRLKRHQSWTKMRSYDSADSDIFPIID